VLEIFSGPTDWLVLTELEIALGGGIATLTQGWAVGFGKPGVSGIARSKTCFKPDDQTNTSCNSFVTADWTTPPQVPSTYIRRATINCTVDANGGGSDKFSFLFRGGIKMQSNTSLVLWQIAVNSSASMVIVPHVNIGIDL
jgi:hypothetical protein